MKVAIVGAGVAGLATGWRLAQAGCAVEVFDRGLAGRGATWASAGIIAAHCESGMDDGPMSRLAQEARGLWPTFASELEVASGQRLYLQTRGTLLVAFDDQQEEKLRVVAEELRKKKMPGSWLSDEEARALEPMLAANIRGALHALDSAHIENRALGAALATALRRAGGTLHELHAQHLIAVENGRARGLVGEASITIADAIVFAGGAWTNSVGGIPNDVLPPVRPVKGQMAALVPPNGGTTPKYPAAESDVYIVPRADRVLLGATVEEAGFDTSVTMEARDWLVARAVKLMPSLAKWRVAECWAGLRPATPDGLPVLGPTRMEGLFVAGGQFRNGILLAPAVADAMRAFVLGEKPAAYLSAFFPRRFVKGLN
ncbi:MAG: glycine oxidase ThiO [Alphaproteobacteria bacterium]